MFPKWLPEETPWYLRAAHNVPCTCMSASGHTLTTTPGTGGYCWAACTMWCTQLLYMKRQGISRSFTKFHGSSRFFGISKDLAEFRGTSIHFAKWSVFHGIFTKFHQTEFQWFSQDFLRYFKSFPVFLRNFMRFHGFLREITNRGIFSIRHYSQSQPAQGSFTPENFTPSWNSRDII
jgi:hypothetical protein